MLVVTLLENAAEKSAESMWERIDLLLLGTTTQYWGDLYGHGMVSGPLQVSSLCSLGGYVLESLKMEQPSSTFELLHHCPWELV